ncbi:MAG: hypothetical protein HY047_15805 [Acidobacteria bacterium]|nr:hypothetical protein [Acidobacteriota bacterium]
MPETCTVLVGASDVLTALKQRADSSGVTTGEVLTFSDVETPHALETITKRKPSVIALERAFAATPRGAALITRIKADPSLTTAEIRVMAHDSDFTRVVPRTPVGGGGAAVATATAPLDQRGTRRAPRVKMKGKVDAIIDGKPATVANLSTVGAQVVSATVLKPNQKIKMTLTDDTAKIPFSADVAWSSFEIPPGSPPRYRAGITFVDADPVEVDAFCGRHKA